MPRVRADPLLAARRYKAPGKLHSRNRNCRMWPGLAERPLWFIGERQFRRRVAEECQCDDAVPVHSHLPMHEAGVVYSDGDVMHSAEPAIEFETVLRGGR